MKNCHNIKHNKSSHIILKFICTALIFTMLISLIACNNAPIVPEAEEPTESGETDIGHSPDDDDNNGGGETLMPELTRVEYVDQLERTVELSLPLTKVAPYSADASAILFSLIPDKMAGWWERPIGANEFLAGEYANLPEFKDGEGMLDIEAVKSSNAELIIAMGAAADKDELDGITQRTGIPVIYIASSYDSLADAYMALGGLFAIEDSTEDYVDYIALGLEELTSFGATNKAQKKIYIGGGENGLTPMDSGILALIGAKNAVSEGKFGKAITVDEIKKINDIARILFNEQSAYDGAAKSEEWSSMEIVMMNMYDCAPEALFNWLSPASTPESILGAKWLANLLYPDVFDYDMTEETKLYYDMFFHVQLTNEQAEAMLKHSTSKPVG